MGLRGPSGARGVGDTHRGVGGGHWRLGGVGEAHQELGGGGHLELGGVGVGFDKLC